MTRLRPTKHFVKAISMLGPEQRKRAEKSITQFIENQRHPSINFERIESSAGYHTIRVDRNFRIVLRRIDDDTYDVVDIDDHDTIYRRYG